MEKKRSISFSTVISALLTIAVGVVCCMDPKNASATLFTAIGVIVIAAGAFDLIRYAVSGRRYQELRRGTFVSGIVKVVLGIVIIVCTKWIIGFINVIFGVFLILDGLTNLDDTIQLKRHASGIWKFGLLSSLVVTAIGLLIVFHPIGTFEVIVFWTGVILIIDGICHLFTGAAAHHAIHKFHKEMERAMEHPDIIDSEGREL